MRVSQFLSDHRVAYQEVLHAPAYTSQKLAKSLHISGHKVVKSVLLRGPKGFFVAVLPAAQQVDLAVLTRHSGGSVRLATLEELHDQFLDCEWGAALPFGRLYGLTTLLEAAIPLDATIVFEAQRHAVAIKMQCRDFVKLEHPERVHFALGTAHPERSKPQAG